MNKQYSVVILAGGKSTRMGFDKSTIDWNGKPLLLAIVEGFHDCDDLFLSVRNSFQKTPLHLPCVIDEIPGCGPLSGIVAALHVCKNDYLFVTTCDAPFVTSETADILISHITENTDAAVPLLNSGMVEPLCAIYRKNVMQKAVKNLKDGKWKLYSLLASLKTIYVPAEEFPMREKTFTNLNTQEDIAQVLNKYH